MTPARDRPVEVGFVLLSDTAIRPTQAKPGDGGFDLYADSSAAIRPGDWLAVPTGVAIEIPFGFFGLVLPRSGMAVNFGVTVLNAPGLIDSGYRGEVKAVLVNHSRVDFVVEVGDRIAQLMVLELPSVSFVERQALSDSIRGMGGFGHSGR